MLAAIITVVFLAIVVGPIVVLSLLHFTGGGSRARAAQNRAQELHDLAVQRQTAGETRPLETALQRQLLLDQLAARFPRDKPLPYGRRELYDHLTVPELEELVRL